MSATRLQDDRHRVLTQALMALRTQAKPSETDENSLEVILDTGVKSYLASELHVTDGQAGRLFDDLGILELVDTTSRGPRPPLIRIKANIEEVTEADVQRIKAIRGGQLLPAPSAANGGGAGDEDDELPEGARLVSNEEVQRLLDVLTGQLDVYEERAQKAEVDLATALEAHAATQEELEEAKRQLAEAKRNRFVFPAELVRYLPFLDA